MEHTYRLDDTLPAIRTHTGGVGSPGEFVRIPEGSVIAVQGEVKKPGMIEVLWDGCVYVLFGEDLMDRGTAI